MKIFLDSNRFGHYVISNDKNDETVYVQVDYDFPGLASSFGWTPCDDCRETDGTVPCEHRTVGEMIQSAAEFLDDVALYGNSIEDPGYFG